MFTLNVKVVYPGHGVALISRIIEKMVGDVKISFFELKFLNKEMTILVPLHSCDMAGIRKLSSNENIDAVFKLLAQTTTFQDDHSNAIINNWNKRSKDYQCKLRTGDIEEIGKIYRDLQIKFKAATKELSFGEKALLRQTETLLVEEISLVLEMNAEKAIEQLRSPFQNIKTTLATTSVVKNKEKQRSM